MLYSDIDDCKNQPCQQGKCEDRLDGYKCKCKPGWEGINCEKGTLSVTICFSLTFPWLFIVPGKW